MAVAEAGGTDVIDSVASGRRGNTIEVLCPAGTKAWLDSTRARGASPVVVTPFGTRFAPMLWSAFVTRMGPDVANTELLALSDFDDVIGPNGLAELSSWTTDCPDTAELARL